SIAFSGVPGPVLNALYSACDVFLFPSLEEGLGLPVAEAMTCGLPVVASDIEVMREVTGGAAILANPTSAERLASGVMQALADPAGLSRKGYDHSKVFEFTRFKTALRNYLQEIRGGTAR
ncbi:Glycosyl transferase, group 1 domain protein, partial [mine drainage metagenome]